MAEIKKYMDLEALSTLVDQIQVADETTLNSAKSYAESLGSNYDDAGTAATKVQELADGAVATNAAGIAENKAAIAKLNGDATTEGSVAKAVADVKAELVASIETVDAIADKNAEDIAAINNADTGILAQAKAFATDEDAKIQENVDNLAEFVGVIPEGYDATTIAEYAKELADNVAANGYDDAALSARVDANASAITALQAKDTELAAKDTELEASIAAVKEDVDAFLTAAEVGEAAVDTLKEIQEYITSDGEAAAAMTANIQANADAISALETADAAQDEKIAALEAKFGGEEGTIEDQIDDAKQEAIDTAATDATNKADKALADAKTYTDGEIEAVETTIATLQSAVDAKADAADVSTLSGKVSTLETDMAQAKEDIDAVEILAAAADAAAKANAQALNLKASQEDLNNAVARIAKNETDIATLNTTVAGKADTSALEVAVARIAKNETDIAANTSKINSFTAITSDEVNAMFA